MRACALYVTCNMKILIKYLVNAPCRAIGDLAGAGVIGFDEGSKQIAAHPEALIMTRSMVKFHTMELLVKMPAAATIAQVR